jgi:hypothetical protein
MILERYGCLPLRRELVVSTTLSAPIIPFMMIMRVSDDGGTAKMNRRSCKQKGRVHEDSALNAS